MKRFLILIGLLLFTLPAHSQIGQFYTWMDNIALTTADIDSTFNTQWESVTIWASTAIRVTIGAPDTTDWDDRDYVVLSSGSAMSFGPATKLNRLEFRAVTGTGYLYMVGYKKTTQAY